MSLDKLIHSLDVQEIAHFRKFAFNYRKDKEQKKILQLFNLLIDKPNSKDEELAEVILKNQPAANVRFIKFALKDRLINALVSKQKEKNPEAIVFDLIKKAELLKERVGFNEALRIIEKAIHKASLIENTELILLALKTKKRIVQHQVVWKENADLVIKEIDEQINKMLKRISLTEALLSADHFIVNLKNIQGWELPSTNVIKDLDQLMTRPVLIKAPSQENFEAYCLYHMCHSRYFGAKLLVDKKYFHEKTLIEFMQLDKEKLKYFINTFRTALNNYLNTCIDLKKFDEFDLYIKLLENSSEGLSSRNKTRLFLIVCNLQFNRILEEKNFEYGYHLVNQYESQAIMHYGNVALESFHAFHINAAIIAFLNDDYKLSSKLIAQVLSKDTKLPGKDLIRISQLLNLLSHFSLENFSNVDSIVRNMSRNDSSKLLLETEKVLMNFVQKHNRKPKSNENWAQLLESLLVISKSPQEFQLQDLFQLTYWIKRKLAVAGS